ncbi:MAG: isochorismatase [Bacteroidetes bacterium GWF2_33_16]|nr:MAG: isochorismatase [Bacteroidetes bacterium GWE2_32_14]OFY05585.1 MAG: isochorismatase [Bacteroidetes bacterium GWF2_33_16]
MKAILVIDMQKISFTPKTPRFDTEGVVKRINLLTEFFRKNGDKVIFIQHDGAKQNECLPGTEEWEILDPLNVLKEDCIISKTANDSFYNSKLDEFLIASEVNDIVITGCATDFCVDSTIKSALTRNYNITVISNGHTTASRHGISAQMVIDLYNWIWSEMIPVNEKIKVVRFEDYIPQLV